MSNNGPQIGQLVQSKAGRDKNSFYLIYDVLDSKFVWLVDGDYRKTDNPKKKNINHLKLLPKSAEMIGTKLLNGEKASNAEIKKAIEILVNNL